MILAFQKEKDGLYMTDIGTPVKHIGSANYETVQDSTEIYIHKLTESLHRRLPHANESVVTQIIKSDTSGISSCNKEAWLSCVTSITTDQTKRPAAGKLVYNSLNVAIHSNQCGQLRTPTFSKMRYFVALTAVLQRYVMVHVILPRFEVERPFSTLSNESIETFSIV